MTRKVNFVIGLHCHQPVGNFDHIFEEASSKSYEPFLTELEKHPNVPITLHISGCLLDWLEEKKPALIEKIKTMVARKQLEIMGGGYYEPILTMLPYHDKIGQLTSYREHLEKLFGTNVSGAWITERIWEQGLVKPLAESGIKYFCVDDTHFKNAGLKETDLTSSFITEDEGQTVRAFAINEKLRYAIPFRDPSATIDILRSYATEDGQNVIVYADDGEKFGLWPGTFNHLYRDGWLGRFFSALEENSDWLRLMRLDEACELKPAGKIYLPDSSYREMTEWALPSRELEVYEDLSEKLKHFPELLGLKTFLKCGFWRNFKVKYPEANKMYSRMMEVSGRVEKIEQGKTRKKTIELTPARRELYRAQCNCAYWHGVFGGLYLPHLRSAIFEHLINSDRLLDEKEHTEAKWLETEEQDFNFDGQNEVAVKNKYISAYFEPGRGGQLYELDLKEKSFNIQASFTRKHEAYHRLIRQHAHDNAPKSAVASIHDGMAFKQEGLEKLLHYDWYQRNSFIDHFFCKSTTLEQVSNCNYRELGDFVNHPYDITVKKAKDSVTLTFVRTGAIWPDGGAKELMLTKKIKFKDNSRDIDCEYCLENLYDETLTLVFGTEFNFALLAGDAPDRYYSAGGKNLGNLSTISELAGKGSITIRDDWQQIGVTLEFEDKADIWLFPIKTVSQSESGAEAVFQNAVIIPHWNLKIAPGKKQTIKMQYNIDCGKK